MIEIGSMFDEPHHQSLELFAARALANDDIATAFKMSDRRCRIPPRPEPHCYVLRGDALYRLGYRAAAIADIAAALAIDPGDLAANRRMLAWANGPDQVRAARAIINNDNDFSSLRTAVRILYDSGQRSFARVLIFHDAVEGWSVWEGDGPLEISITDGAKKISALCEPDVFHPLADFGRAAAFRVRRPQSTNPQLILLTNSGRILHSTRTVGTDNAPKQRVILPRLHIPHTRQITVIVPIYGDYDATRACLDSLGDELRSCGHSAILVNDATPDIQIEQLIADQSRERYFDVLVNPRNIGFIGSVNRALEHIKQGDVVILNSDTIVPRGFLNRLASVARSSTDIGTVTPLSNNAEFLSFPIPNRVNPLGPRHDVERIDAIAAKVNSDRIVDIPSGIGFCLYVTRACLDCVGPLADNFAPGYLEDVDFCLRAAERGFRNICAPSVFVGHAGSKSFAQTKRALVVRNLRVLEQRFPKHRAECAAFMAADPLGSARAAVECVAAKFDSRPRLIVTGAGPIAVLARHRGRAIASTIEPVMVLEVRQGGEGTVVEIKNAVGGIPQSLRFNLACSEDHRLLAEFIRNINSSRIEFLDPANTPFELTDLLFKFRIPYDLFIADSGLAGSRNDEIFATPVRCLAPPKNDNSNALGPKTTDTGANWITRWRAIADGAEQIIVPSAQAEDFAKRFLLPTDRKNIVRTAENWGLVMHKRHEVVDRHLAFLPVRSSVGEQLLMTETARQLHRIRPDIAATVIGATLDDVELMRSSKTFVTGAFDDQEFEHLVDAYGITNIFISVTRPIFAHPILSRAALSHLPTAYFDWSAGRVKALMYDLPIDPKLPLSNFIDVLNDWMPNS